MSTNQSPLLLACVALAFGAVATITTTAQAALGGSADSVASDGSALRGQLRSTAFVNYDVQEIDTGALAVREYLTRAGRVFAVSWQGPTLPDLQQLLGTYFGEFQTQVAAARVNNAGIHRQLLIDEPDLVVASAGRLRDFFGIAYVPGLVPAGVSVGELQ